MVRDFSKWPRERISRLSTILIKRVLSLRKSRNGKQLKPKIYKKYIAGVKRAFKNIWHYDIKLLKVDIFCHNKTGSFAVRDKKIRKVQQAGDTVDSANILTICDIKQLYNSPYLIKNTAKGFIARIKCNLAFVNLFRIGEIYNLKVKDVCVKHFSEDDQVLIVAGSIAGK